MRERTLNPVQTGASSCADWDAIVCGAGPAGLASAAVLQRAGLRTLVVERGDSVGMSWRSRYDSLRLNSLCWISSLPGERGKWGWRHYPTREEWIEYLDCYARNQSLAVRFGTDVERLDHESNAWTARTSRGPLTARLVVVATGHDREAHVPEWPGRESFGGLFVHAADYRRAGPFRGKDVVIAGANTTGVELASDLVDGGARRVWVSVRTPPNVIARHWLGLPMHAASLLLDPLPLGVADRLGWWAQRLVFGDLGRYGLTRPPMGIKSTVVKRGMGPAVDDGFVDGLKRGAIELVAAVDRLRGGAVLLADGTRLRPDVLIAATGYRRGLEPLVGHLDVLDGEGRPRVHAGQTLPQAPGLYFVGFRAGVAGPLRQMRLDAKRLARVVDVPRAGGHTHEPIHAATPAIRRGVGLLTGNARGAAPTARIKPERATVPIQRCQGGGICSDWT